MNTTNTMGKVITAAAFFILTGAAAAAEHSPGGVTVEEWKNVSRLIERLGARIDALENKNRTLEAGLNELRDRNRALEGADTEFNRRLDALAIPDISPVEANVNALRSALEKQERALAAANEKNATQNSAIAAVKAVNDEQSKTIDSLVSREQALMVAATGLQAQIDDLDIPDGKAIESGISALRTSFGELAEAGETMRARVDNLIDLEVPRFRADVDDLKSRLAGVTRTGDTLRFDAMNVQVTNGTGATDGEVNGLGNLIIGYNEAINPFIDRANPASDKSGSHNLVVGKGHNYPGYGGLVAGLDNVIAGNFSVAAGTRNRALGDYSTVTGGQLNTASGWYSSVSGGFRNLASENSASVSGGQLNAAAGAASSVSGGFQVRAPGNSNWAAGGLLQQQ